MFLFHNVIGHGYCFYRSILQDALLEQQFHDNFHALRSHVVDCVRTHELRYTLMLYLFHIENTNFLQWRDRMKTFIRVLQYKCWTRAIDVFLMVLVLKIDIAVISRCPRNKCLVSKSYFEELNRINNGSYRRTSCHPRAALELTGPPIYVLFHSQGNLNSSDVYAFNLYGYLKQVNGQIILPVHVLLQHFQQVVFHQHLLQRNLNIRGISRKGEFCKNKNHKKGNVQQRMVKGNNVNT